MNTEDELLLSVERQNEKPLEEVFAKVIGVYYSTYILPKYDEVTFEGSSDEELLTCKKLLNNEKITKNEDLRYFILSKLYRCYIKNSMYNNALCYIWLALSLRPESLTTLIRKAEVFEYTGNENKSIRAYEHALKLAELDSGPLAEYIRNQIKRIKYHGVRKAPAVTGLRYMTY